MKRGLSIIAAIALGILSAGCGDRQPRPPCDGVTGEPECTTDGDCEEKYVCWCGLCAPEMCTGDLSGIETLRKASRIWEGEVYYQDVKDVEYKYSCVGPPEYDDGHEWSGGCGGSKLACLTSMRSMDIDDDLTSSDISFLYYLTELEELDLSDNDIDDIGVLSRLIALRTLDISSNEITDISPLSGLVTLTRLNLSEASVNYGPGSPRLTDISALAGLTNLESLDITWNAISDITVLTNHTSLVEFQANRIKKTIVDLDSLANCTMLENLVIRENIIEDISSLANLTELVDVDLYGNRIITLEPLVENQGIGDGDIVNLGYNPIDCTEQSGNIQILMGRGVDITTGCP